MGRSASSLPNFPERGPFARPDHRFARPTPETRTRYSPDVPVLCYHDVSGLVWVGGSPSRPLRSGAGGGSSLRRRVADSRAKGLDPVPLYDYAGPSVFG